MDRESEKKRNKKRSAFEQRIEKCNEIADIGMRNECKIKILEEEIIDVKKKISPMEDFVDAVKEYAEPKFNALGVRMGNIETTMVNFDTRLTNLDTKVTSLDTKVASLDTKVASLDTKISNLDSKVDTKVASLDTKISNLDSKVDTKVASLEEKIVKGIEDLKKGQIKIAKEPAESLYK